MHRRGLQCIPKRSSQSIPLRCYHDDSIPRHKLPLPQQIKSNVNLLIQRAAHGANRTPLPKRFNKRRAGTTRSDSQDEDQEPTRLALHNYPWRGGVVRRLNDSVRRANDPGHVPTIEKQALSTVSPQEQDVMDGIDPIAEIDTADEIIKHGVGSFVELRRYISCHSGPGQNLLIISA